MIDNIRHKSVRKKTGSRIAAIQILYLHHFNDQPLDNSILTFNNYYKKFLLEKLEIKELEEKKQQMLLDLEKEKERKAQEKLKLKKELQEKKEIEELKNEISNLKKEIEELEE